MNIKHFFSNTIKITIIAFIVLLLVAIGVKYQQPLNDWNNSTIKGEKKKSFANLYLNNYSPTSETWNLKDKMGEQAMVTNQYGREVSLGGLITGTNTTENSIKVAFNSGLILHLSDDGDLINRIDTTPFLEDFTLEKSNGGVRAALWLNDDLVFIYYTASNTTKDKFKIRAAIVDIKQNKSIDNIELGKFDLNEHYALGGGIDYDVVNNRVVLAIGAASGTDDTKTSSKAQDDSNLFGKIVGINLNIKKTKLSPPTIISKGHRNPQGLTLFNKKIYAVEHGPKGGDELNLISQNGNYGWNNFSYGTKYIKPDEEYNRSSNKYIEPIYYFTPSIGISDVSKCPEIFSDPGYKNCLLISSMRDGSFYLSKFNPDQSYIQSMERVNFGSRIRKIEGFKNSVYLFTDNQSIVKISYSKL
jgi:glucose/arabinose dehydrogenase